MNAKYDANQIMEVIEQRMNLHVKILARSLGISIPAIDWSDNQIAADVALIAEAANNERKLGKRISKRVNDAILRLEALPLVQPDSDPLMDQFKDDPVERVIEAARYHTAGEMISHGEAAEILFQEKTERALMRVKRLIERGALQGYRDPNQPNPRHAQRVMREQVDEYKLNET